MIKTYSYDDVLLVPQYSDIRSRSEIDISTDLTKGIKLQLPIFASPMDTISEGAMASALGSVGASAIIHRYNTIKEQARMRVNKVQSPRLVGAAIGVSGDYLERASALADMGADFLCVDVAHGHHVMMKDALYHLRHLFGDDYHIMAGNVATLAGIMIC
jgi:IMP dehydrogenase